jgi:hypothetical protein
MTENNTRRYHLRLKAPFAWYDSVVSQQMHEWAAGSIVTDQTMIALLESIHAPTEKVCEGSYLR